MSKGRKPSMIDRYTTRPCRDKMAFKVSRLGVHLGAPHLSRQTDMLVFVFNVFVIIAFDVVDRVSFEAEGFQYLLLIAFSIHRTPYTFVLTGIADVHFPSNPILAISILNLLMHVLTTIMYLCCRGIGGRVVVLCFAYLDEIYTARAVVEILVKITSASINVFVSPLTIGNVCFIICEESTIRT